MRVALRTQQILAHESGVADTVDPLGGAYSIERLTGEIEEEAEAYIAKIDALGGSVHAIAFMQREIQESAYRYQLEVESKARVVVGVNEFVIDEPPPRDLFQLDAGLGDALAQRLERLRKTRDHDAVARALEAVDRAARGRDNPAPRDPRRGPRARDARRDLRHAPRGLRCPSTRRGLLMTLVRVARRGAWALAVAVLSSTSPAPAGVADQVGATFGLMIQEVVNAFPAVEGLVVAVDGDRLFIDLTQRDGVQPGQEFTIFRKGDVFRHPVTGQAMGRFEDVLGYAQVKNVQPQYAEALYVPPTGQAQPEDGVRITRGRIRVAVAPPTDLTKTNADLRRVPFMIAHALGETKRFLAADPAQVQEMLLSKRTRSEELLVRPESAVAAAKTLEVAGWLVPVLIERRGVTFLDVTWVSGITGTALFSQRLALTRAETTAEQRFPWEPVPQD